MCQGSPIPGNDEAQEAEEDEKAAAVPSSPRLRGIPRAASRPRKSEGEVTSGPVAVAYLEAAFVEKSPVVGVRSYL